MPVSPEIFVLETTFYAHVTQWWCFTTAPGTLGVTRHLLGLVSLGLHE